MNIIETAEGLFSQGIQPIPVRYKVPIQDGWQTSTEEPNGNFNGANGIGVVLGRQVSGGYLCAFDVDCLDKPLSRAYYLAISEEYGKMPTRFGNKPKFLIPFICTERLTKRTGPYYDKSRIEVLGAGQQFVSHGFAGEGVPYVWHNGDLVLEHLPVFTPQDVDEMMVKFGDMARAHGLASNEPADPFATVTGDFLAGTPPNMTTEEVQALLDRYPAENLDYDRWVEVGMALYHQTRGSGYGMWLSWSELSSKHDAKMMKRKWESFDGHDKPVTIKTIIKRANAIAPPVLDDSDFDVIESPSSKYPGITPVSGVGAIEPRKILMNGSYIKGYLTGTAAAGGVGKTSLVDVELMSMALGEDLLGQDPVTGARDILRCGPQRVLMLSLEDDELEMARRRQAIYKKYALPQTDIDKIEANIMAIFDDRGAMKIVSSEGVLNVELVRHLVGVIKAESIDIMTIDPLVSFHSASENDNVAMQQVMQALRTIARVQGISVHYIHHNRKGGGGSVDDMRGAGALKDGSRHVRMLTPMNAMEAELLGVPQSEAAYLVGTATGKGNFDDPSGRSKTWFKLESVSLGNGNALYADDVLGVIVRWTEPNTASKDLDWLCDVVDELNAGSLENRKASNSPNYIIRMVCRVGGLDYEESALRKKARSAFEKWVGAGWIEEYQEHDSRNGKDYSVYRSAVLSEVIRSADLLDGLSG